MPSTNRQAPVTPLQPLPWWRYLVWFLILLTFSWYLLESGQDQVRQTLAYTQFKDRLRAGEVARVRLDGDRVSGRLRPADPEAVPDAGARPRDFTTTLPPVDN